MPERTVEPFRKRPSPLGGKETSRKGAQCVDSIRLRGGTPRDER